MSEANTPLYLSRLILDLNCRQVRSELAQPYEMHRTLMHAFDGYPICDGESPREKFNVLFRADVDDQNGRAVVYVQSVVEPDWSYLDTCKNYLLSEEGISNPAYKNVALSYLGLRKGQTVAFSLRANPTKRIAKPSKGDDILKGKRVALLREEEQIDWLVRKGDERKKGCPGGFEILAKETKVQNDEIRRIVHVNTTPEGKQTGYKKDEKGEHRMIHLTVRFDGLLGINDPDAFRETLVRGIGPAKAF
ncbi:MAG TPA: type I-E CRISPR-associated protein Cas6/Cse3/CasE, partial [Smithella sp.]|nr:type I-E CRISPR-associated protein Cas6/Cse3/CasE [Smithella sp.]HOG89094.1 type I-E CRISPR-associated protein Cas6/Cse3/CasE [Smithella sp.]